MNEPVLPPPGRLVRLGVVLPADPAQARHLAVLADLAGIDVVWAADATSADQVRSSVRAALVEVLPAADPPWARTVPVSIGRTSAEAAARADLDPEFGGHDHPTRVGVYGTLEEGQAAVAALAHEGITDLRCILPRAADLADVVAQLTAIAVGSLATHGPQAPRSPDPPPPPWAAR
jgi:hypothetical protein